MHIGRKWCDHPACLGKQAVGTLKLQSNDSLLGKTRVQMNLCSRHYNEMLEFLHAYVGGKREDYNR